MLDGWRGLEECRKGGEEGGAEADEQLTCGFKFWLRIKEVEGVEWLLLSQASEFTISIIPFPLTTGSLIKVAHCPILLPLPSSLF